MTSKGVIEGTSQNSSTSTITSPRSVVLLLHCIIYIHIVTRPTELKKFSTALIQLLYPWFNHQSSLIEIKMHISDYLCPGMSWWAVLLVVSFGLIAVVLFGLGFKYRHHIRYYVTLYHKGDGETSPIL